MIHLSSSPTMSRSITNIGGAVQQHRADSARYRSHEYIEADSRGAIISPVWPTRSVNDEDVNNC